ncbi:MAG: CBS domain-containing protein [Gammaproteobacteria bacterium]|nr:CBS domain-containing protein [Gammaproteobacteria bacterium]MDH5653782.1 CBS domain-containing protein [Gammaproteobacteria bacterium]
MTTVADLLKQKSPDVYTISPDQTVFHAIQMMDEKGVGALAVVAREKLAGMISERDYARKVILNGRSSKETQIKEIMTTQVYYVSPEQDTEDCMIIMTGHHIRHLPVLEETKLVGMISLGDVVKDIIKEQQDRISSLEKYLSWESSW